MDKYKHHTPIIYYINNDLYLIGLSKHNEPIKKTKYQYSEEQIEQIIAKIKWYMSQEFYALAANTINRDPNARQIQQYCLEKYQTQHR